MSSGREEEIGEEWGGLGRETMDGREGRTGLRRRVGEEVGREWEEEDRR